MADIQAIYSILLARNYQEQLFSSLPGKRKKEKGGRETLVDCPLCHKESHFSYSSLEPLWRCWSCGESGDWIKYLEKTSGLTFQQALQELASIAGVEISPQVQTNYQTYVRKADILETAQDYFTEELNTKMTGQPAEVYRYLQARGYTPDDILNMDLGAYVDRQELQDELKGKGYTEQEIKDSGLLTQGFGVDYQLTLLWKDQAGRAIGIVGRPILSDQEIKAKGLSKYKYSYGLEKDQGLIGFSSVRGSAQVVLVEGVLDALFLNYKGFKVVAMGGTSLSTTQLQAIETAGTKEILLAMDMDTPGQDATEKILKSLAISSLRAYVVSLPGGYKDPDDLVRKAGAQAFQEALEKAERWSKWLARRIVSKQDISTDRGLDKALEEALDTQVSIADRIDQRAFLDSLRQATGLSEDDLASRLQEASQKASAKRKRETLQNHLQDIQQKASQGDIIGAELELSKALKDIQGSRGVEAPEPYLVADLITDILSTSPSLATGYKALDKSARIPIGAITIIAGRPGHGKTTFQLNILANLLKTYPAKKFYFFSYEESRKAIATKLIMIMAGQTLEQDNNYGAYINYLKEKRGSQPKIERALQEYEHFTSTGRLIISDRMAPAEDLAKTIGLLAKGGEAGAVIVDYIQRIPVLRPAGQRYLDIKLASSLLLEQAVSKDIPIILGAQLGRDRGSDSKVKLDNLRESGDIEQDANLVLGLYNQSVEKIENRENELASKLDPVIDLEVSVLKNRAGVAGRSYTLTLNRPVFQIIDKDR